MKLETPVGEADWADAKIIPAPSDPADIPAWRQALLRWRAEEQLRLGYDDSLYQRPEFAWARHCFACHLVLLSDQLLLDYGSGKFTSERYLEYAPAFGGMDALVLWHAYLNLGFDEPNQFDFYHGGPGGRA